MGGKGELSEQEIGRELRRVFRRLAEVGAHVAPLDDGGFGLFIARNRWRDPVLRIEPRLWSAFVAREFVRVKERRGGPVRCASPVWCASEVGIAHLRRLDGGGDRFRAQHQERRRAVVTSADGPAIAEINETESPLAWLRRRKGPDGRPLISEHQYEAGDRLRRDFTLARMDSRVTTDWTLALAAGGARRAGADFADASDRALAARERVAAALAAVGPGLRDVLLSVCCHLEGLEDAERALGWPRRAGKVVLQIALDRLAAHYGMKVKGVRRAV